MILFKSLSPNTIISSMFLLAFTTPAGIGQTSVDLRTQSKSVDFSSAAATKPFKTGTVLPLTCGVGETFFLLNATAGENIFGCTSANTWTLQSGTGLPDGAGNADSVLSTDGSQAGWRPLGGDVSGPPQAVQVNKLKGRVVSGNIRQTAKFCAGIIRRRIGNRESCKP